MLDQLSGGRVDLGVGRGISPFEHRLFGHDPDASRERFAEILPMVVQGLSTGRMDSAGAEHFDFPEVELPSSPSSARTRRCGRPATRRRRREAG